MDRMGDGPTQPIIHTVIIDTMLKNNRLNNGHGLKKVTCKEDLGRRKVYHRRSYIEGHPNCS